MHWDVGFGFMPLSFVFGLLFWALLIVAVVLVVRAFTRPGASTMPPSTAEQILAERFARGEIDGDEYQERLRTLRGQ